jgi:hypothetical protein
VSHCAGALARDALHTLRCAGASSCSRRGRRHTIPAGTRGYRASPSRAARLQAPQDRTGSAGLCFLAAVARAGSIQGLLALLTPVPGGNRWISTCERTSLLWWLPRGIQVPLVHQQNKQSKLASRLPHRKQFSPRLLPAIRGRWDPARLGALAGRRALEGQDRPAPQLGQPDPVRLGCLLDPVAQAALAFVRSQPAPRSKAQQSKELPS